MFPAIHIFRNILDRSNSADTMMPVTGVSSPDANGLLHFIGWQASLLRSHISFNIYTKELASVKIIKQENCFISNSVWNNCLAKTIGMNTRIFLMLCFSRMAANIDRSVLMFHIFLFSVFIIIDQSAKALFYFSFWNVNGYPPKFNNIGAQKKTFFWNKQWK